MRTQGLSHHQKITPSVVVVGSANLDIVVPVARHPLPGETVLGGNHFKTPGGKGANQAVAAARLGQQVAMIGRVGDDSFGNILLDALGRDEVDTTHLSKTARVSSGIALIAVDDAGENSIIVSPGANAQLTVDDIYTASTLLESAQVTLLQLEVPLEAVLAAAKAAKGVVILNPAPARVLPPGLLREVDIIVPNRLELASLLSTNVPETLAQTAELARQIEGPEAVVITLGSGGALLVTQSSTIHVPAFEVEPVDTTAAGDCFCGALADAIVRQSSLEDAVAWAVLAAALAVTRHGAQESLPKRGEVERLRRNQVSS
jgi:ribokinase